MSSSMLACGLADAYSTPTTSVAEVDFASVGDVAGWQYGGPTGGAYGPRLSDFPTSAWTSNAAPAALALTTRAGGAVLSAVVEVFGVLPLLEQAASVRAHATARAVQVRVIAQPRCAGPAWPPPR